MPAEEFRKRRLEARRRGDKYMRSSGVFLVNFDSNFDVFAANVAYELRYLMTYRSDGGNFARGVVRASGDLQAIHTAYTGSANGPPANGTKIRLNAIFYRRQDVAPTNRWMMSIRFNAPDFEWANDADEITASQEVTQQSQENGMKAVLHCANLLAADFTGQQGDQIRKMLAIADRVGYRRNWDLWYYNRAALSEYMDFLTAEPRRVAMAGQNRFEGYVYPHGEWKIYPFRDIAQRFGTLAQRSCDAADPTGWTLKKALEFHWFEIAESLNFVNKQLDRIGNAMIGYSAAASWLSMLDSLIVLQGAPDHLYSAFKN
jgi:hypothetical protein